MSLPGRLRSPFCGDDYHPKIKIPTAQFFDTRSDLIHVHNVTPKPVP